jgi:hypothetical protein
MTTLRLIAAFALACLSLKGAYDLSGGRFRLGGSEYTVKLSAVGSIRRGTLTFTFTPKA